ncbi:MAG: nucleotidyl transferase AbiEii/AbiGii toxin family protein [Cytophagales bacterium]|nr:nucleotidyl transferase AbiEii/AbiGii toxin family protein [Cytophagales bacterium]
MLRTEGVSPQLLKALRQLMEMKSLKNFRLVGGTALSLQLGHRESMDIDLFTSNDFSGDEIAAELIEKFNLKSGVKPKGGIMIRTITNEGVKVDIVDHKNKFIRNALVEDGIRMAHPEEIAAMKIKITCDPFTGRKTKKDLVDVAALLDKCSIKEMVGLFKEKYSTMAPYEETIILRIKDFDDAEKTEMPKMLNELTWEMTKKKIEIGLKDYFDGILKEREMKLRKKQRK